MKITGARITRDRIPLATPFVTALRRVDHAEFIVLELQTDRGLHALGSAPATKAITGETLESIECALRTKIVPALTGKPFELDVLLNAVGAALPGNSSAKAAADMALFTLAAQAASMPLYRFLGGQTAAPVKTAVTVSLDAPDEMARKAAERYASGYDLLKIKVGGGDGRDAQRIRAVADAVPNAVLLIDANQAWHPKEALNVIDRCPATRIALIEQPVAAQDIEGLREITLRSPYPVLADEAVFDAEDARRILDMGAADLINIKLMKCGGIAGALTIIDVCREYNKKCMLGSMLEGPVSITAALHLAAAYPDVFEWIDLDSPLLYRTLPADLPFSIEANRYAL
jgi:L-alanine-DL-glutamate epimerase-like enolase superfamily enzyme